MGRPVGISDSRGNAFVVVGVAEYENPAWEELTAVPSDIDMIAGVLTRLGFGWLLADMKSGGESRTIQEALAGLSDRGQNVPTLIVYWSGHGALEEDEHFLLTRDSPRTKLNATNAVSSGELGRLIAQSTAVRILLLLDTCYSGSGALDLAHRYAKLVKQQTSPDDRGIAVISSAQPYDVARDGRFSKVLVSLLSHGAPELQWSDRDRWIYPDQLHHALIVAYRDGQLPSKPDKDSAGLAPCIPNPRFRPDAPDEQVEAKWSRTLAPEAARSHFLPAARGVEVGEPGWFFTGRDRTLGAITRWLREAEHGLLAVTGRPGSGKSAIAGRLATLSHPGYREEAERVGALRSVPAELLPPAGSIDVVVHAKGKTRDEVLVAIAEGLRTEPPSPGGEALVAIAKGLRLDPASPGGESDLGEQLTEAVAALDRRTTILIDALDEAARGEPVFIADALARLARRPKVRVIVATRGAPAAGAYLALTANGAPLITALSPDLTLDISECSEETRADVARYAERRLLETDGSPLRERRGLAEEAAATIADRADGVFLFARIMVRTLLACSSLEEVRDTLSRAATDLAEAVDGDLNRFGADRARVIELLRPLAWAEGSGVPRRQVWPTIATALSQLFGGNVTYTDADITWILQNAGFYIVESGEDEQAVYRLYHQALAEYFRRQVSHAN